MEQSQSKPSEEAPLHPNCARCGAKMRLFGIEPHPTIDRTDLHTYECAHCDAVHTEVKPLAALTLLPRR